MTIGNATYTSGTASKNKGQSIVQFKKLSLFSDFLKLETATDGVELGCEGAQGFLCLYPLTRLVRNPLGGGESSHRFCVEEPRNSTKRRFKGHSHINISRKDERMILQLSYLCLAVVMEHETKGRMILIVIDGASKTGFIAIKIQSSIQANRNRSKFFLATSFRPL